MSHPSEHRQLNAFSLAALLVCAHYGLGFLLGTGERALTWGTAGSLYALSIAVGTFALLGLAQFYWEKIEQIWTLLGTRYGKSVQVFIGAMSWLSLIGIEAVQTIAGVSILSVLGAPTLPCTFIITLFFLLISLVPIEKAGRLFQLLLGLNIFALLFALSKLHGFTNYVRSPLDLIPSLQHLDPPSAIGTALSTILLVLIDMKYQQYIVRAKTLRHLYGGCILAALLLFCLALLPSTLIITAQQSGILPPEIGGKEAIPYILLWLGGGTQTFLGIALIFSLLVPALGVGSSILRMQTKTILDFGIISPTPLNSVAITSLNASLGLAVALKGGSIISLIVEFYAVYVATVFVPFVAYLLAHKQRYIFADLSVQLSLGIGGLAAIFMLILTLFETKASFSSPELVILGIGIGFGMLGLFLGQAIANYDKKQAAKI
jgi:SSS family solute:Na+ symporter